MSLAHVIANGCAKCKLYKRTVQPSFQWCAKRIPSQVPGFFPATRRKTGSVLYNKGLGPLHVVCALSGRSCATPTMTLLASAQRDNSKLKSLNKNNKEDDVRECVRKFKKGVAEVSR